MGDLFRGYTFGATEEVTATKLHTLVDSGTVSNIVAADFADYTITDNKIQSVGGSKFINLSAIPSAAGKIPDANISTTTLLELMYPVGIVITLGVSTNPATLFGFGTWQAIAGKVIVGIDATQTEFDTLNETGGAKTADLSHTHTISRSGWGRVPTARTGYIASANAEEAAEIASNPTTDSQLSATQSLLQPYIVKYVYQRVA